MNLKLLVPKNYLGEINNFLQIHDVVGEGRLMYDEKEYEIGSKTFIEKISDRDAFVDRMVILEARSDIEIFYLLNPKRFFLKNINNLEIVGGKCEVLDVNMKGIEL